MPIPINRYFSDATSDDEYIILRRSMEKQRILAEASIALKARKNLKKDFEKNIKSMAEDTKLAIEKIKAELDTGIKGQARNSIEKAIEEKLPGYDNISS